MTLLSVLFVTFHASAAEGIDRQRFVDIYESDSHRIAIEWLADRGIAKGYNDDTFRPDRTVNRAEAIKMIVSSKSFSDDVSCDNLQFSDVPEDSWFASFVCIAAQKKWIDAEEENRSFRPSDSINAGELSVLLARIYDLEVEKSDPWYASSVQVLADRQALPPDIEAAGQAISRGQLAEFLWRLETHPDHVLTADPQQVIAAQCNWRPMYDIPSVDDQEVTRAWMTWVNKLRVDRDLEPYSIDRQLSRSAQDWADHAKSTGSITHKRPGQTSYYDYKRMTEWFASEDLTFENIRSTTFTENIGWGVYTCSKQDCTQNFIDALRTTFDFFRSEEGKASRAHWNSMVNPDFRLAGVGIAVDQKSGKYYFTAHYGTAITSKPDPVCP